MERVNKERDYFASDADTLEVFHTIATILAQPKPYDRIGGAAGADSKGQNGILRSAGFEEG